LPHANLFWTGVLAVLVAIIMASAFSAILVYAQELLPGRVGLAAGMFYGFSFGLGGLGAAALGKLADLTSIATVYRLCPLLLLMGLLTAFLPRRPGPPCMGAHQHETERLRGQPGPPCIHVVRPRRIP